MKKMKFFTLLCALVMTAALASSAFAASISLVSGGPSGTYAPIGKAIAETVSAKSSLQVTPTTGNASVANLKLLGTASTDIAFAQNDTAYWAYHGQMMFKEPLGNLRAVAALYPEHVQLLVAKGAKISSLQDLAGKNVGVGAPGSGVEADVRALFKVAGLTYDQMKVDFLDFGATSDRFKANQIDAGFVVAGYPTASVTDVAASSNVDLVNFSDEFLGNLVKQYPYFVISSIPSGTYKGIDHDVKTPAAVALLLTHDKVADDVVYTFTKTMFENLDSLRDSHAKAKEISLNTALQGLTVPLHPGAAKYFAEKGLKLP